MLRRRALLCQHLEHISRSALEKHQQVVRELIRGRHGIYALYRLYNSVRHGGFDTVLEIQHAFKQYVAEGRNGLG